MKLEKKKKSTLLSRKNYNTSHEIVITSLRENKKVIMKLNFQLA
jgi:hypothetical protein